MNVKKAATELSIPDAITDFLKLESAAGVLLIGAATLAMVVANSPLAGHYDGLMDTPVGFQVGALVIHKPMLLWINDGLMAVFFLLIGLEIKREILEGELSSLSQIALPAFGAVGGMTAPAAIYVALNWGDATAMDGWAVPVATDIAFALGLLTALGSRVPTALKVFLMTLAIFDDLAAIVIIALFYSGDLSMGALAVAGVALGSVALMNRMGVTKISWYMMLGAILWVALLKSGVHATLAGVVLAFCIPMRDASGNSPLKLLEGDLHSPVAFLILPVFAFANAGLSLSGLGMEDLLHPVTLGVIAGLLLGNPIGILITVRLAIALGFGKLPRGVTWGQMLGVGFTCGIGFTMSLFIAGLAFEHGSTEHFAGDRLGILIGSLLSAIAGYTVLSLTLPKKDTASVE